MTNPFSDVIDNILCISEDIEFVESPSVQQAREDQVGVIRCKVKGDPTPTISWYYNGEGIDGKDDRVY